jgi:AcrR family transcriptional regulator
MARPQAPQHGQRREAIVARAAELFARRGYSGSSINDLAVECGISKSLLYHYFPSKEDILDAVMASHLDLLLGDAANAAALAGSAEDRLRRLLHDFMGHYVGASARQKVLLNELGNLPDERRRSVVAKQRELIATVQSLLCEIHPALAAEPRRARVATMLLFGMINWTLTWYDPEGGMAPSEVTEMVLGRILAPFGSSIEDRP